MTRAASSAAGRHGPPVDVDLRGLWRRLSLEWGGGRGDVETTVFWLQTESLYCDIRLPLRRPRPGLRGFADLTAEDAVLLARQEAFAGRLTVTGGVCEWERWIDYAPTGSPDRGRCTRAGRMLVETGAEADYVEHWWQALDEKAPVLASVYDHRKGVIAVAAGQTIMTAVDRRAVRPPPGSLQAAAAFAAKARDAAALTDLLDCEIAMGTLSADGATWTVSLSTLPWSVGEQRLSPFAAPAGGHA